ncbi:MAG: class III signal peptide-containing protein [Thermococcus sp.]|uniref:class III signal peptide-containing protein n=1 Tax=Thermococcus sp. TaxID=35749 RepID=UPI001D9752D3|nr:class III signal peptide-containing protein [Thermococcus sp.]MBO8175665.1 class III signal peptide-containing protein [Thermococcus sp.]
MRRAQTALEYLFMMTVAIMVLIILYRVHPQSTSGDTENLGTAIVNATSNLTEQVKEEYNNL